MSETADFLVVDDDLNGALSAPADDVDEIVDWVVQDDPTTGFLVEDDDVDVIVESLEGVPGSSAYDEAVRLGFDGTPAEWLESLHADATDLVDAHVHASEPHPAYDDMVDLSLIFENGLV